MKQTATLLLLVLCLTGLSSQVMGQVTIQLDPCPVNVNGTIWDGIVKAKSDVTNIGATGDFAWERTSVSMPAEWSSSVCDPNQCYAPTADAPVAPGGEIIAFAIDGGATVTGEQFYVQFIPNGVPGTGVVELRVYEDGNPNNFLTCTFTADLVATSVQDVSFEDAITMYPNPAREKLYLAAPAEANIAFLELYNVVGLQVARHAFDQGRTKVELDLADLKEGIYFARVLDKDNKIVVSRRFSKVN